MTFAVILASLIYLSLFKGSATTLAQSDMVFAAEADARVLEANPDTNYGSLSRLDVDNPGEVSYIRFTVTGVADPVQNARLRLYVGNGSTDGPGLYGTDNSWEENGLTWNNQPGPTTGVLANIGSVAKDTWAEYDLTGHVTGDGTYSFVFIADGSDGIKFESREGSPPPELVLTFEGEPASTPTDTPTSTSAPSTETPTPTNTAIPSTETPTPTNTAIPSTATSTATNTPGPSTATNTPLPSTPTNTPLPPTLTSTPSTTAVPSGLSLNAVADARVLESNPGTNYGTLSRLDVDSPGEISYIRFTVSGVSGPVQNARLRLFVSNGSFDSPGLYGTDNSWTETGLTWSNRPPAVTGVIANLGLAAADTWVEYDLTGHVTGNGTYSFVFLADGSDGIRFESRESSTPPQLGLTFATGPTSTPTNTPTPGPSPTPTHTPTLGPTPTATNTPSADGVIFVGAGDIADCGEEEDELTAQLLDNIPGTVYTVGDNAYPGGTTSAFNNCYQPTWGRHKARTHPAVGDNEYSTAGASGYFNYFGAAAGEPGKGYYSYDVGSWHIIVLNSNCSQIGGCDPESAQGQWLQADLAANPRACILAIHHEPLFSSKGGDEDLRDFWAPLYEAGADIVLSGHRHMYERFAQQNPDGVAEPGRGIRQFVVGTGGSSLTSPAGSIASNSQVRNYTTHGVLKFTLYPTSYNWEFIPIAGQSFTDSGSVECVTP